MTPKEKAIHLCDMFYQKLPLERYVITTDGDLSWEYNNWKTAKECALIAVDEIIQSRQDDGHFDDTLSSTGSEYYTPHIMYLTYWLQVIQEIEKL
jgi:hypothetical protein